MSQELHESGTRRVRDSTNQGLHESGTPRVRDSTSQGLLDSGTPRVRDSYSQGLLESGTRRVRDSVSYGVEALTLIVYSRHMGYLCTMYHSFEIRSKKIKYDKIPYFINK